MSSMEKLFMSIFDRKQWIGEQLWQQVDSYEQSLACNLVANGREIPPWLFDGGLESRSDALLSDSSNRTELNGKQIIPELLFPSSRVITTPANHSTLLFIPPCKPIKSFQDSHLTGACFSDNHIQNLQINEEMPSTSLEDCHEKQLPIEPDTTDIAAFSTIQRSRSRQKAVEKRSSGKKSPVDTTVSFRQTDNTKAEIIDNELIQSSNQLRTGDGKERKLGETDNFGGPITEPNFTETLDCVETGVVGPKGLAFDVASTVSRDNPDSVTEKHDEKMSPPYFGLEKDLLPPGAESCGISHGEKGNEAEILESPGFHSINPVRTETLNSVETSTFEPKRLVFSSSLVGFRNNLDSVVENHDETRVVSHGILVENKPRYPNGESSGVRDVEERVKGVEPLVKMLSPQVAAQELTCSPNCIGSDVVTLKRPGSEPRDRPSAVLNEGFLSTKILDQSGSTEIDAMLQTHDPYLINGVRGGTDEERDQKMSVLVIGRGNEQRDEDINVLVKGSASVTVNTEPNESPLCMDNDKVQDTQSPKCLSCAMEGSKQIIRPSVGESTDVREVEPFYARDSYSPIGNLTGDNNEGTEVNEPVVSQMDLSNSSAEIEQSPSKNETELESAPLSEPMEIVGEEVLGSSDKRKHSVTSTFHDTRQSTSLSGDSFVSCESQQATPVDIVVPLIEDPNSDHANMKFLSTNPKCQGDGSLVKSREGIKRLPSGGRYFLQSSVSQGKSNASCSLKHSGEVQFHVNVHSWPKRRRMEVFSDFTCATSPRPRKGLRLPKASYCRAEEGESETSVLVLEEYNRVPSMSSSSADKGNASVSPTEPTIESPTFAANHFSISPKEGDMDYSFKCVPDFDVLSQQEDDMVNTVKYVPEFDVLGAQEGDLANSSKYVHEIGIGTSSKYDGSPFINQEDTRPELEAFTMGISSDSEGETRNIPETSQLHMERTSVGELTCSSSYNLTTPHSCSNIYKLGALSDVYKSVPTGHFNFMIMGEAFSLPANARKQLSASVSSIPHQSGPFGYPGFEVGLSTSGKSGKGRPPLTPPVDKVGYRRGIPPLTPLAEKFSYSGNLSEIAESGSGSGIRSSGKAPLYPELTCFRIDEDDAEDDIPNDNDDALDQRDMSALLEENTLPEVNNSQNLLEDEDTNYQDTLCDITTMFENTENTVTGVTIPENFSGGVGYTGKKSKQSAVSSNKRGVGPKASGSLLSGLATVEANRNGQEKSMGTVSSKPSNIVSEVTSFVPLVKQKQQPVAKKREVRIPALEAAEAKKKMEEKKRHERELQKAAMKAEREKMNQEKLLKKKQMEEQKKEADMAAKKRQREERDKKEKEKEKKRKGNEIDRPTQRELPKKACVAREEKELQHNVVDEKEQSKRVECGKKDAFVRQGEMGSSIIIVDDVVEPPVLPREVEKSYEMSPFKDSDAEGDDYLDEEAESRRKKFIPSWARKEFLEDYLQSKKYMNPDLIFSCKCSFDLSKVLKPRNPKRQF